jgi:hypothetical protein
VTKPTLSVVLATTDAWPDLANCLAILEPQAEQTGAEIIVGDGDGSALPDKYSTNPGRVVWIRKPGASVFELRALCVDAARAPIIATTEDHCVVEPDWCERVLAAHAEHPDALAVAGAVTNGSTTSRADWANFLHTFGAFTPPLDPTQRDRCPVNANISYKRAAFPPGPLAPGYMELQLNGRLFREGGFVFDDRVGSRTCSPTVSSGPSPRTSTTDAPLPDSTAFLSRGASSRGGSIAPPCAPSATSRHSSRRSAPASPSSRCCPPRTLSANRSASSSAPARARPGSGSPGPTLGPRPLRIIHITPTYAPCVGGAERMLQAVSERLVARGHLVSVFAVNGATQGEVISVSGGSLAPRETINGVLVRRFPPEDRATRLMRGLTDLPGGWRSARSVLGDGVGAVRRRPGPLPFLPQLLRAEVDVVTTVNWVWAPAYAGHLARRFRRFRLIGVPILHIARPWADSTTFRPMLAQCDLVLASTTADADFMRERGARHTVVTGMGVDPAAYTSPDGSALRARFPLGDGPVVGFVGRQDRHKGAVTLLEAMAVVWERFPEARLLLAGQSAHRSDEMRQGTRSPAGPGACPGPPPG